ncbi:MAG: YifB family Mg chelatase-like AAA ATPase [Butyricicoccaceae bacterium]
MMQCVHSAGIAGMEGFLVTVECDLAGGLPGFEVVGLPGAAVRESRERVRAAAKNSGFDFPVSKVVINLAPADIRKEGPVYDLPILMGILAAHGQISALPDDCVFIGELSLSGALRPVSGVLSMALAARDAGKKRLFLPMENAEEAALAGEDLELYPAETVRQIVRHFSGEGIERFHGCIRPRDAEAGLDFSHVMGQQNVKRALEIAAAGGHNVLMSGSPGSGKSMMAKRIGTILPPMTDQERMEVVRVYSSIGQGAEAVRMAGRPIRAPHHTTSAVGMAGGGSGIPKPGEVSLAHNGTLYLDELPEFGKEALEVLRQPLEDGTVSIVRAAGRVSYPARFMMICAMNPCKCGWYGHPSGRCRCTEAEVHRYRARISGPLLDRIDIQLHVMPVPFHELANRTPAESSADIRARVIRARERQRERYRGSETTCNAYMTSEQLARFCTLDEAGRTLLERAFEKLGMTARSYDRVLKLARTIADLEGAEQITAMHLAEAVQYRFRTE